MTISSAKNQSGAAARNDNLVSPVAASKPGRRRPPIMWPVSGLAVSLTVVAIAAVLMLQHPENGGSYFLLLAAGLAVGAGCLAWIHVLVKRRLVGPLNEIRDWAADVRSGNLSARLKIPEVASFAELATAINRLGDEIQSYPGESGQAERLAQKTRMLEVLYEVATNVSMTRDLDELLSNIMAMLLEVTNASAAVIYLKTTEGQCRLVDTIGLDQQRLIKERSMDAGHEPGSNMAYYRPYLVGSIDQEPKQIVAVPLQYRDEVLGVCNLCVAEPDYADREDIQLLLTSIGQHLGMAIEQAHRDLDAQRLSIVQERTTLAYELHDSLAQTLASLRFNVRVLDEILQSTGEYAAIRGIEQIETSLDEAHTELRQLIAHFSAPEHESGLVPSVDNLIKRFREETGISVFLQNEWMPSELPAGLEIQVVRIIQEALTNIKKHSRAHNVRVYLRCNDRGDHRILVEDDGVGFEDQTASETPGEQVGMGIMRDRAQRLGGELRVDSEANEGTRIELFFQYPYDEQAGVDMQSGKEIAK